MWPFIGELISGMPFDWPALNSFVFFFIKLAKREQFRLVINYLTGVSSLTHNFPV